MSERWLSPDDQLLLMGFLGEYLSFLQEPKPQESAITMYAQLETAAERDRAIRRIVRMCDAAQHHVEFKKDCDAIRALLAKKLARDGEDDKDVFHTFGLEKPAEPVTDEEIALWDAYCASCQLAWEIPAARIAGPALAALDTSRAQGVPLAEFLDLYRKD